MGERKLYPQAVSCCLLDEEILHLGFGTQCFLRYLGTMANFQSQIPDMSKHGSRIEAHISEGIEGASSGFGPLSPSILKREGHLGTPLLSLPILILFWSDSGTGPDCPFQSDPITGKRLDL